MNFTLSPTGFLSLFVGQDTLYPSNLSWESLGLRGYFCFIRVLFCDSVIIFSGFFSFDNFFYSNDLNLRFSFVFGEFKSSFLIVLQAIFFTDDFTLEFGPLIVDFNIPLWEV